MVESTTDLGTVKKLLDQVLEEVRSLKSIIQSEDSVVGKKVPAPENSHTNVPVLWYDELNFGSENPDYYDDQSLWPNKNLSGYNEVITPGYSMEGDEKWISKHSQVSELIHYMNLTGDPYRIRAIDSWDDKEFQHGDNLYFIEITQVHSHLSKFLTKMPEKVKELIRHRKLTCVFWFPHEGFSFNQQSDGRQIKSWMHTLHQCIIDEDLIDGMFFMVYGDLRAEKNYNDWWAIAEEKYRKKTGLMTYPKFLRVVGVDWFNHLYYQEWSARTAIRIDPRNYRFHNEWKDAEWQLKIFGVNNLARIPECFIHPHDLPEDMVDVKVLHGKPRGAGEHQRNKLASVDFGGTYQTLHHNEILESIPDPQDKTHDLVCLNARIRPHRLAIVSELFRLGYNNKNSFISFVARDAKFDESQGWVWQDEVFRDIDETSSTQVNHWIDHVTHDSTDLFTFRSQKEYFWKHWHENEVIELEGESTELVDDDDRFITLDHYKKSYFSLVSETLFGAGMVADDAHCLQLTEKVYKPIAYCHPFMVLGSCGTLRHLKSIGYKTFPDMFDERYDDCENPVDRFNLIMRNLEIWRALTDREKKYKYEASLGAIQHNYELWKNSTAYRRDMLCDVFSAVRPSNYGF